ncbi:hypothetical protein niasHT_007727 [Heterodera trifolii]|uniref:Tropomyosin n=1 Tax=Heterodera trifolii TaxID=157864 RepID=A0ABD2MAE5_9BILA
MDAIKKKMQAMKIEKDNAIDRADAAEEKCRQTQERLERVEEELRDTQKKMMATENELDKAQEDLTAANNLLEEKEKKVQEVGLLPILAFPMPLGRGGNGTNPKIHLLFCTYLIWPIHFSSVCYPNSQNGDKSENCPGEEAKKKRLDLLLRLLFLCFAFPRIFPPSPGDGGEKRQRKKCIICLIHRPAHPPPHAQSKAIY